MTIPNIRNPNSTRPPPLTSVAPPLNAALLALFPLNHKSSTPRPILSTTEQPSMSSPTILSTPEFLAITSTQATSTKVLHPAQNSSTNYTIYAQAPPVLSEPIPFKNNNPITVNLYATDYRGESLSSFAHDFLAGVAHAPATTYPKSTTTLSTKRYIMLPETNINAPTLSYALAAFIGNPFSSLVVGYDYSNAENLRPIAMHEGKPSVVFKRSDKQRYLSRMKHVLGGTPLRIDSHNVNRVKLGTASVCVELDVSKSRMTETWISFVDDEDPNIVVEDCKRDFDKEDGKGPQAPYVHRRRQYRRVMNPSKAVQLKRVVNDVKKMGALDPVIVAHLASSSGTKESDLAPPNFRREEKDIAEDAKENSMAIEVTVGKDNVHTIVQTRNTFAGLENVIEKENDDALLLSDPA
ncbi:hypothetical protein LIER_21930 [Lithospermum erythrorhizon]|uniref:Uncharacterized protein n=1 Tax=Lithospermum erythrorhizon TaxID=34254 RepID=A0AAV3QT32_LITER